MLYVFLVFLLLTILGVMLYLTLQLNEFERKFRELSRALGERYCEEGPPPQAQAHTDTKG